MLKHCYQHLHANISYVQSTACLFSSGRDTRSLITIAPKTPLSALAGDAGYPLCSPIDPWP